MTEGCIVDVKTLRRDIAMQILKAVVALLVFASVARSAEVAWLDAKQLDSALIQAQSEGKPILVHFGAAWCGPCQVLKKKVFPHPKVATELRRMITIEVDLDRHADVAERFGVQAVPFDIYLDSNAQVISSQASPHNVKEYVASLQRVLSSVAEPARLARAVPVEFDLPEIRQPEIH